MTVGLLLVSDDMIFSLFEQRGTTSDSHVLLMTLETHIVLFFLNELISTLRANDPDTFKQWLCHGVKHFGMSARKVLHGPPAGLRQLILPGGPIPIVPRQVVIDPDIQVVGPTKDDQLDLWDNLFDDLVFGHIRSNSGLPDPS